MSTDIFVCARALQFASGLILVGVMAFRWLVLLPAYDSETDEAWAKLSPLFQKLHLLFLGSGLVVLFSGLALFWAVSSDMSGLSLEESLSSETLGTVLFQTQFGTVCLWRLGFALVLVVAIWRLHANQWLVRRKSSPIEFIAGSLAAALVVSLAWMGHAASTGNCSGRLLADMIHLFAASIWPTGLLPFALFLYCVRNAGDISPLRPVLAAIGRFSDISFIVVFVLIGTGIINSYFTVGSFTALANTGYGRLLSLKLFLFLAILCIASFNRYRLVPRLFFSSKKPDIGRFETTVKSLQGFVMTELGIAFAIVLIVSLLGITPPAR